jgi:hypothetical protein
MTKNMNAVYIPPNSLQSKPEVLHDHEPFLHADMRAYLAASEPLVVAHTVTEPPEGSRPFQAIMERSGFMPRLILDAALRAKGYAQDMSYVDRRPDRGTVPESTKDYPLEWHTLSPPFSARTEPHPDHRMRLAIERRGDHENVQRPGGIPEISLLESIAYKSIYLHYGLDSASWLARREVLPAVSHLPSQEREAMLQRAFVTSHILERMRDGVRSIGVPVEVSAANRHPLGDGNVLYGNLRGEGIEPFTPDELYALGTTAVDKFLSQQEAKA